MPGKTYQLFLKGLKGETNTIIIDKDASIAQLRQKVSVISGIPDDEFRLLYGSRELRAEDDNHEVKYLEDFNIGNLANLFLVLRLLGGSEPDTVQQKMYDCEVQLTTKPDMFTMEDDIGGQRAEMPCGHAIGPESLTAYCRSLLDAKRYEFRCPYKKNPQDPFCDTLWDLFTVKRLAVLTTDEINEFEIKIAENYLRKAVGIQECPKCQTYCERRSKKDVRVVCRVCTNMDGIMYEFCWCCLKTWLYPQHIKACGNSGCTGKDPRLRIVKECPKKLVIGVLCPAVRMCPKCGMLIEHKDQCKQMQCPCGQRFCFICLNRATVLGRYRCGAWDYQCQEARRQSAVPGD